MSRRLVRVAVYLGSLLILAAACFAWSRSRQAQFTRLAQVTHEAIRSGSLDEAEAAALDWVRRGGDGVAELHFLLAVIHLRQGRLADADCELDRARTSGYDPAAVERLRGLLHARMGRATEAEPLLLQALQAVDGHDPEVAETLARIFLETYRFRLAMPLLQRWSEAAPDDPKPWLWMTEIDERTDGGFEAAINHYTEALRRDPDLDQARLGLAESLRLANRLDESARAFGDYLDRRPDDPAGLVGAARADIALGQIERAAERLDRVIAVQPDHTDALRELAAVELARGDAAEALGRLDALLADDPFDAEAHYRRGVALDRLERPDEALQAKDRAAQLRDDQARLRLIQRRFNEDPGNDGLRLEIARWMMDHGQGREGVRWALTVIGKSPEHPEANDLLAEYYTSIGDPGLANFYRLQADAGRSRVLPGSK